MYYDNEDSELAEYKVKEAYHLKAEHLSLKGLKITTLPHNIAMLADFLTSLDLSHCEDLFNLTQLADVPKLTSLEIKHNKHILTLKELAPLTKLSSLVLFGCSNLCSLEHIRDLKNLSFLSLSRCKSIPDSEFGQLKFAHNIEHLHLSAREPENWKFLRKLGNLRTLSLERNAITDLTPLYSLRMLEKIWLCHNKIEDISQFRRLLRNNNLKEINIYGNPVLENFDVTQEYHENSLPIIKNLLYREDKESETELTLPGKVLMLGNHAAGKSSLTHYLINDNLKHSGESTHILSINKYNFDKTQPHNGISTDALIYDFGGQDYYHGIYRVFMSQGATTCLLWRPDKNNNAEEDDKRNLRSRHFDLSYWLGYWKHYHAEKIDEFIEKEYLTEEQEDIVYLRELTKTEYLDAKLRKFHDKLLLVQTRADEYPEMRSFDNPLVFSQHTLNLNRDAQTELSKASAHYFAHQLNALVRKNQKTIRAAKWYQEFLAHIFENHEQDSELAAQSTRLTELLDYYNQTDINKVEGFTNLKTELEQLHLKGIVLYYPAVNPNVVWLNPMAFTHYVHDKLLNQEYVTKSTGIVPETAFKQFDQDIISVLEKEKVIFRHLHGSEGVEYIIPNYLPLVDTSQSQYKLITFGLSKAFAFSLWFEEYLPIGLINQLICHFGNLPNHKIFWRNQLIFTLSTDDECETSMVQITLIFDRHLQIKVYIANEDNHTRGRHMAYVYYVIMNLYNDLSPLHKTRAFERALNRFTRKIQESEIQEFDKYFSAKDPFVAIYLNPPEDLNLSLDDRHFIRARDLTQTTSETRIACRTITPSVTDETLSSAKQFLTLRHFQPFTHRRLHKMLKVFISYAHADVSERQELQKYLITLERDGIIDIWQDGQINPGDDWHNTIVDALTEADIVIMLVSQSFIASSYVNLVELPLALSQQEAGTLIFPVLLKHCDYQQWRVLPEEIRDNLDTIEAEQQRVEMGNFQFFPVNDKCELQAMNQWDFPEKAWTQLSERLRHISEGY